MAGEPVRPESLYPVDAACLHVEDRTSLIVNVGVMLFGRILEFDQVKEVLWERFRGFRRFRQRVVPPWLPLAPPRWEDDPIFDLGSHVRRVALPSPGDDLALARRISDLSSTPLDRSMPLRQAHLIENHGKGCALLFRIHHCMADGMALVRVLRALTGSRQVPPASVEDFEPCQPPGRNRLPAAIELLNAEVGSMFGLTDTLLNQGLHGVADPVRREEMARAAVRAAEAMVNLLLREPDSPTVFKGSLGVAKGIAWSRPLRVGELRSVARWLICSINEVLIASVTGALRRHLVERGQDPAGVNLHVSMPVNLRHSEARPQLGNRFSINLLALPVDCPDPVRRVELIRQRLVEPTATAEPDVMLGMMALYGLAPAEIGNLIVPSLGRRATAVLSSVPGPPRTAVFAGVPVERLSFWVPQTGRLGLGLSLLTYRGEATLGVMADTGLLPDPWRLVAAFEAEAAALMEVSPEGGG